ncbi:hypothetical protein [Sinisalibacter lacisalsi]|uniref:Uncharacterized protein n=1 Tax=Sinisalibacter lacisalsi TaxID=1526570 RepID=A0ABQ1QBM8_9RHOB|nr:hypothetical protein [Sinisalibacter lacisalsi]GGD22232.1 hypothetical protein GCM10011358_03400 [Sinisalibacter lacisalsi]
MTIDFSQVITAEDKAAREAEARAGAIKTACEARITAVLDDNTVKNLLSARLRGQLTPEEEATFDRADDWKWAMIEECRRAIAKSAAPKWPLPSDDIIRLVEAF